MSKTVKSDRLWDYYDMDDLRHYIERRVVGQSHAIDKIIPYVDMFSAGISPEDRPIGVFLLAGPTGCGKTRIVEVLAGALHGSEKNMVTIDCGEFQMEHEVARLIGAPPGYLGHRETVPILSQKKINEATSERSRITIVLLDEIEKAAKSFQKIMLGVFDKGRIRMGDGNEVNMTNCLIFMTSNIGSNDISKQLAGGMGFNKHSVDGKLVTDSAIKKEFSPEFINRVDEIINFNPLSRDSAKEVLGIELKKLHEHLDRRVGINKVTVRVDEASVEQIVDLGYSPEYGARKIKRVIADKITKPLAKLISKRNDCAPIVVKTVAQNGDLSLEIDINVCAPEKRSRKSVVAGL